MATPPTPAHANTVGWYILEGYPWWPVYICDQFKLRPHLYQLGDGHKKILKKAKDFHRDYALVYYFGSHDFSLVKLNKGILKPWECSEKDQYIKGHPKHLMKKGGVADELSFAVQEVEDYLSQPEDMRLPPHMVPSDLDPTLEPPPPMERPADLEDGDEDGDDADDADEDADADADGDPDGDDDDGEKKPKKAAKKKPAAKKEKAEKEKKPKKEKKEKEKKPPKEKKEKKTPTKEKKESAAAAKKKSDAAAADKPKEKASKLKRQRSSGGDGDADAAAGDETAAKAKQPKKEKASDVKSESAAAGDSEDIAEVLEREIRWILSNEQYEEMTTKMLRKVLEDRLKRDLKQHRDTIKAVVTRVIEEEEETAEAPPAEDKPAEKKTDADGDVAMEDAAPVKKEEPTPEPAVSTNGTSEVEKSETRAEESEEAEPVKEEKVESVEKEEQEQETEEQVSEEAPPPPPPKPVEEADILALKEKLLDENTSHEELLASLNELQQMPLEFKHLKRTGIPRVVAKLRQHANDKVSIAAKDLRNAWMQLVEKEKQPTNLKELEKLRDTLEAEGESEASKLSVLKELDKLSLSTQEIIDAKIGVSISKLRKSSNADVAQAANKLRQKWKKQAEAARP